MSIQYFFCYTKADLFFKLNKYISICRKHKKMPNNQHIPARERQRIRARVSEVRRVPLSEVPYPRSNMDFYQYLFEAGEVSQHQFNHLVFRHYYPIAEQSEDFRRNRINNINRIFNIVPLEYRYTVAEE